MWSATIDHGPALGPALEMPGALPFRRPRSLAVAQSSEVIKLRAAPLLTSFRTVCHDPVTVETCVFVPNRAVSPPLEVLPSVKPWAHERACSQLRPLPLTQHGRTPQLAAPGYASPNSWTLRRYPRLGGHWHCSQQCSATPTPLRCTWLVSARCTRCAVCRSPTNPRIKTW